ncbi:hypothetical protein FE257_001578 [Aspergillus nanangensis]|uniref:Uncharacterized protein n=1 Tax=Aspergillus nanangensis TaxID=2582783 RepID=A0AAD4GW78_ASPNN|nr:hypothetical protein FE257_001578 [Aspergillus nanangensis]
MGNHNMEFAFQRDGVWWNRVWIRLWYTVDETDPRLDRLSSALDNLKDVNHGVPFDTFYFPPLDMPLRPGQFDIVVCLRSNGADNYETCRQAAIRVLETSIREDRACLTMDG